MPEWAWISSPFVVGLVATALIRIRWPKNGPGMALIGLVLAFGIVVWTYYHSAHSYAGSQGDEDGEMFLGRWWEPTFVITISLIGCGLWLLGVGAGIGITAILNAARRALRERAT
jgi:hypothetical protein